jgi:hypothetical protein
VPHGRVSLIEAGDALLHCTGPSTQKYTVLFTVPQDVTPPHLLPRLSCAEIIIHPLLAQFGTRLLNWAVTFTQVFGDDTPSPGVMVGRDETTGPQLTAL